MGGISSIYEDGTDRFYTTYTDRTDRVCQNIGNKIQTPGITRKKEFSIQNTAQV